MTMKQLFRHTSTLLRSALLLGAMAFVNIHQIQAQTEGLPDAFLTIEPTDAIGDTENWYYIQFYDGADQYNIIDRSYLADEGVGNNVRTKDYIPFAKNIQWQFEDAGNNQFFLRSRNGNYIYLDGTNYKCGSTKTALSITKRTNSQSGGGWDISISATSTSAMCRESRAVWADIIDYNHNSHRYPGTRLRIAKLKENIAHIIYYQDPISGGVSGNTDTRGGSAGFTKHHYLTYSGLNPSVENWMGVIANGNMETGDVSSFYTGLPGNTPVNSTLTSGVGNGGGKGIVIQSVTGQTNTWDTQFFIQANEAIPEGTKIHVKFDYRADNDATVGTQAHGNPGHYHWNDMLGNLSFSSTWKTYNEVITVTNDMVTGNDDADGFRTIAFNLGRTGSQGTVSFYFDNVAFEIVKPSDVSNRT